MDPNSSTSNNNPHQKDDERKGNNESNKKLCDLPDDIVQKILSHLPTTKEIIRTSVLSKRWLDQWKGMIKIIDLDDEGEPEKRQEFIHSVERLILDCNGSNSNIKKFSILFKVGKEGPRLKKWLSFFVNPMIEELNLELQSIRKPLVLPSHFFTSQKLTKFEINMRQMIKFPTTINFPNLVTLTLKNIIFPNSIYTSKFFFGLPSMKELILIDCNWKKVGAIRIDCPSLQTLFIRELNEEDGDQNDDQDEEEEYVEENDDVYDALQDVNFHHGTIVIIANELVSFSCEGNLLNDYWFFETSSIIKATIDVHEQHNNALHAGQFSSKLLICLLRVKELSISNFAIEALCHSDEFPAQLPTFFRLVELRLISSSPMNLFCLMKILTKSPFLEEIEFQMGVTLAENDENAIDSVPSPRCFRMSLKKIKIYGFSGTEGEMNAIKHLLQTVQVLHTMQIQCKESHCYFPEGIEKFGSLCDQIMGFPKASAHCEIELQ